jgi:hypothetical protein
MSDLEFGKNKVEMMRYRDNSLSYKLGMGGIACSVLACFFCLNSFAPTSITTLLAIMLNIVILLGGFLAVEKAKSYSLNGSIALIVFGGVCIARIFWIPVVYLIINYGAWVNAGRPNNSKYSEFIGKTITTDDVNQLTWLGHDNGVFRAVLAIVALIAAAAFLIAAGYIGVVRSKKLSTYLNSINQKKVGGN